MKARGALVNGLLALASLAIFAGVAEVTARVVDLRPASGAALANPPWMGDRRLLRSDYRDEMEKTGVLARYYDLYEWDRFLFYRLRADASVELLDPFAPAATRERSRWSVHTNERGFRTRDFPDRKTPGTRRIAVLGDSSTFGWGVEEFQAYPQRLGDALAKRWNVDRERVEVLNLGVPGYSTFQGRILLERRALALEPDAIVWSYLSNDGALTGVSDQTIYAQRVGPTGALLAALHRSRAYETLEAWITVARRRLDPPTEPDPRDAAQRNVASYDVAAANVRAVVERTRAAGIPLVLLGHCTRGRPAKVLAEVANATGTPHLDATRLLEQKVPALLGEERFAAHRNATRERYGPELDANPTWLAFLPDRCHPNALGHQFVADALADVVAGIVTEPSR
jgi:lysophospholipase L1-like esterase